MHWEVPIHIHLAVQWIVVGLFGNWVFDARNMWNLFHAASERVFESFSVLSLIL